MNAGRSASGSHGSTRVLVLIGAVIVQLILGTVYGYSIFWQPLSAEVFPEVVTQLEAESLPPATGETPSRIIVADEAERQATIAEQQGYMKYAFSICILSFAVVMVVAGRIQDITGPRIPALIGATLMGLGFLLAGLMSHPIVFLLAHAAFAGAVAVVLLMLVQAIFERAKVTETIRQPVQFGVLAAVAVGAILLGDQYVGKQGEIDRLFMLWGTIGFLAGAGIGFAYVCPIAALVKWFPRHKGLVSGVAVAGFGFGAFLFKGRVIGALGYIESYGIRDFFVVHAIVCFVGVALGAMLLRNPPTAPAVPAAGGASARSEESTWQTTLRNPAFYMLWLMFFSGAMAGLMVIGIIKVFAGEQLVAAADDGGTMLSEMQVSELLLKGAAAVGWLAIFNAVGRIAWGFVSDLIGRTSAFVAMFVLQAVTMFLLAGMQTELTLAIAASAVGFNFGGNFALFPSATADYFGSRNLGANYGWVFTSYGIAGVVGIAAGNMAKSATGSYTAAFTVAGVLCLVSAGLALALRANHDRFKAISARNSVGL